MTKEMLEERIGELLEYMATLNKSSDEYKLACSNLETLYKLFNDALRIDLDKEKMYEDITLETKKIHNDRKRNTIELVKVLVPAGAGIFAVCKVTKLEEVGSLTTKAWGLITSFFRVR